MRTIVENKATHGRQSFLRPFLTARHAGYDTQSPQDLLTRKQTNNLTNTSARTIPIIRALKERNVWNTSSLIQ